MTEKLPIFSDIHQGSGNSMSSAHAQILNLIRTQGPGAVFVPSDFLGIASRNAIDQTLSRLTKSNTIRRIARGVYDLPKQHPRLGLLSPDLSQVSAAIARSTGSRIQLAGAQSANALGVSTQVPAQLVYLTDGPTRSVVVGNRTITFRHAAPRKLIAAGTKAGTVIQALQYLGRDGVTPSIVDKLRKAFQNDSEGLDMLRNATNVPAWLRQPLHDIAQAA
jgi:hypothetical protein